MDKYTNHSAVDLQIQFVQTRTWNEFFEGRKQTGHDGQTHV